MRWSLSPEVARLPPRTKKNCVPFTPWLLATRAPGGGGGEAGMGWAVKENIMVQRKTLQKLRLDPILVHPPPYGGLGWKSWLAGSLGCTGR